MPRGRLRIAAPVEYGATVLSPLLAGFAVAQTSTERSNAALIAKKYAAESHSARAEVAAAIAEGLCEVHAGKADVGISRLTATLEKARLLRAMLRETLAALVKSFEFLGQPHSGPWSTFAK